MNSRVRHYVSHQTFIVVQIIFFIFFLQLFVVDITEVDGVSMEPTLYDAQVVVVDRISILTGQIKRYDIVQVFRPDAEDSLIIKRVVGLPGEMIEIKPGKIVVTDVNGEQTELSEPYLGELTRTYVQPGFHRRYVIPEFTYFVLGDNREHSADSREFGSVHRKSVLGLIRKLPF
jgi:signal peptidase I